MAGRPRRIFAVPAIALFLGAMGCGRGCTCISGEKTYEHLDGKVKVELVRKTHWTGGKVPGPISSFVVRVHTDPPFDEPTTCEKVDLAEDDAGKNIAFRCDKTAEWTVVRLRGKDRHIRECKPPVGTAKKPAFGALAKVVDVAPQLLDCAESGISSRVERSAEILRSVREEAGSAAATALVVSAAARQGAFAVERDQDSWDAMLAQLTVPERTTALATVCAGLVHVDTPDAAYLHALRWCALDDVKGIGEAALKRLAPLAHGRQELGALQLGWVAALASRAKPVEAAEVACASGQDLRTLEAGVLVALIARAGIRCPAVTAALTPPPCDQNLDCDGGLCGAAVLKTENDAWLAEPLTREHDDAGARPIAMSPNVQLRALLAAAYAQGPLPREILLPNARRNYTLAEDAGPRCSEAELAEGTPCTCVGVHRPVLCGVAIADKQLATDDCEIHIDDAKRRLDARHVCKHESVVCGWAAPCCPGLTCQRLDGGYPERCLPGLPPDSGR